MFTRRARLNGDHPRIRGNSIITLRMICMRSGSPPHTREQPSMNALYSARSGITPAYAGTASSSLHQSSLHRDHPRIRGNSYSRTAIKYSFIGSPPHTREQPLLEILGSPGAGITPAYAGTANLAAKASLGDEDHPRIRGNSNDSVNTLLRNVGSPPHTREQRWNE